MVDFITMLVRSVISVCAIMKVIVTSSQMVIFSRSFFIECIKARFRSKPFDMETSFHSQANRTHFHVKDFQPDLVSTSEKIAVQKFSAHSLLVKLPNFIFVMI